MWRKSILFAGSLCFCLGIFAQHTDRSYLRSGNRKFRDSLYNDAEVLYRKALDKNPSSGNASYNLGTTLMRKQNPDFKQAIEQLEHAAKMEKDKKKLGDIYHNIGVAYQTQKQLEACIEAYKKALRNNPSNDETRYNLVLAQKQLKKQQQQQDQQKDQQKQDEQKQKEQEKKNQDQNQNNQNQQNQQQQNKMSKDAAQQLLNSLMQDERNVQEKVKKGIQVNGKKLDKDW